MGRNLNFVKTDGSSQQAQDDDDVGKQNIGGLLALA
jgi:hypothetical protein